MKVPSARILSCTAEMPASGQASMALRPAQLSKYGPAHLRSPSILGGCRAAQRPRKPGQACCRRCVLGKLAGRQLHQRDVWLRTASDVARPTLEE